MKYLVVGLGNVGKEYDGTRHNIGFDVLDALVEEAGVSYKSVSHGSLAQIKHRGRTILLLKPNTYVNLSGKAVRYWMAKEKIYHDKLLVLVDDLNLEFGRIRLRGKGSDGGHNGLKDINRLIGNHYPRLRLGIGNDFHSGKQVDFVLGKWSEEEKVKLEEIFKIAKETVKSFAAIGLSHTMTKYNK